MAMAIEGSPRLAARLFRQPQERSLCDSLCSAVRTQAERSRHDRFGKWEGMLLGPLVGRRLNDRFGVEHCWSTSQLEQYGYCPHQFFLQHVLKLREIDELSLETNSMLRGRRVHSFFADLHRRLNESGTPLLPGECEADMYEQLVHETLAAVMQRTASDLPLESALDEIDHLLIARWVQKYLEQYRQYEESFSAFDERPRPTHFEVSFGPVKEDANGDTSDPLSQPVAYELNCNGATIRLTGASIGSTSV